MPIKSITYTEQQQRFVDEILCSALIGEVDQNIVVVTYDLNGKVIHATNIFARLFNYRDWSSILGKTIFDIKTFKSDKLAIKLDLLRRRVIKQEKTIYSIIFANYSYGFDAHAVYNFPLFMPDGSVVATQMIAKKFTLYNPVTLLNEFVDRKAQVYEKVLDSEIKFNALEYNLLFLISIRFTQEEAATFMNISRSRLAKVLQRIYARLGVSTQDELILIAQKSGLFTTIPDEFIQAKVIILCSAHNDIFKKSGVKHANK